MKQIIISAAISTAISLLIINHEVIKWWLEDIASWVKEKLSEQGKDDGR